LNNRAAYFSLLLLLSIVLAACNTFSQSDEQQPPPRPTVIMITATGPYFETFDRPGDWLIGQGTRSSGRVENGQYILSIAEPGLFAWTNQQQVFGDGTYELETILISGPEASAFGLIFGADSDLSTFFYAMITGDGRYDIGYCEQSCIVQQSVLEDFTLSDAIRIGTGEVNVLAVALNSGEVTLSINGVAVSRLQDVSYQEGLVGLIGESSQFAGFEVGFDNLSIVEGS